MIMLLLKWDMTGRGKTWCGEKKKRDSRVRSCMRNSINPLFLNFDFLIF